MDDVLAKQGFKVFNSNRKSMKNKDWDDPVMIYRRTPAFPKYDKWRDDLLGNSTGPSKSKRDKLRKKRKSKKR